MNVEEQKIVEEIIQLYKELYKLTYEGSKGAHGAGLPSISHFIRYAEKIRDNVAILCYEFDSEVLSKSNLRDLDDVLCGYEMKELKVESKKMSEQKLMDRMELVTNLIGIAIKPLLNLNKDI